jgi:hypothetical protein
MRPPSENARYLARAVLALGMLMALGSAGLLAIDLLQTGFRPLHLAALDLNEARHLGNVLSRACNQLMAVFVMTVAFAVPLTANMYSLKFLEFFIRDRSNAAALTLVVFSNFNNTLVAYALRDGFLPLVALHVQVVLVGASLALLFPYMHYVFRFLHPSTLLEKLHDDITLHLEQARRGRGRLPDHRRAVCEGIEHVANIAVRSVDRSDSSTAIESVLTLEQVLRDYWRLKPELPPGWFLAEPQLFLGLSSKAVDDLVANRSFVEMKVYGQLRHVLGAAIPKLHDLGASIAKSLRKLVLEEAARRDPALRELGLEFFNTLLRLAINRKDARSVFTLFDQYRTLGEALLEEQPEAAAEIAGYFTYYAQAAQAAGLPFLVESVAHDLAALVRRAHELRSPGRHALLRSFLDYDAQLPPLSGVKKAQAILASHLLEAGHDDAAREVRAAFQGLDRPFVQRIRDELVAVRREKYWEVNERRLNLEYVPEPQRQRLAAFLDEVLAGTQAT